MWILLTLCAATVGGLLLQKTKMPGGLIVGAILAVAAVNLTTQQAYMPSAAKLGVQILTGVYIGCMFTWDDLRHLPRLIKPFLIIITSLLSLNLLMAAFMYAVTDFDLLTCLFSAVPGGVSDTPIIAMDMGANSSVVAVMQLIRLIFGIMCLPTIILLSDRMLEPEHAKEMDERAGRIQAVMVKKATDIPMKRFIPCCFLAAAAGVLGSRSGMPAGAMSFSLILTAALKMGGLMPGMPPRLRQVAQIVSGACIGATINRAQVLQMPQLLLPAAALCLAYILCCVGMGFVVSKVCRIERREAMLCLSPAGSSEMALIAADMGVESTNLIVIQICRLISVMLLFPQIFAMIWAVVS